jgi:hypothetical protein
MSQVISLPAAFHLLCQVAVSAKCNVWFVAENSRSAAVAVTVISALSLKRLAVSLALRKNN